MEKLVSKNQFQINHASHLKYVQRENQKLFEFTTDINAVDKDVLQDVPNPDYGTMLTKHPYLMGVKINENQTKATLPIHVILGANDFTKIKTQERPRIVRCN